MRPIRTAVFSLILLLAALPAAAYIIVLKDGSKIVADHEYRVEKGRAIITLPNGTETFLDVKEIDRQATEAANKQGYGSALVIKDATEKEISPAAQAQQPEEKSLAELAAERTRREPRTEPQRREDSTDLAEPSKTLAGYVDLGTLTRRPFPDLELASEMQRFFRGQGIDNVELYQGTQADRPFAEITTNSEASVFRALQVAAEALLAVRESHPKQVAALEVLLATPDRSRAGQFVLTPDLARELVGDNVEVSKFFVENVEF
jgi:hypothetical protein